MLNRREFIKAATIAGGVGTLKPIETLASRYQVSGGNFGVHPFIENNPDAVFIMKTNVDVKTNRLAMTDAGLSFARSVIVPKENGVPVTSLVPIKPNITNAKVERIGTFLTGGSKPVDAEYLRGVITDPFFVEGVIGSIKELGVSASNIHVLDSWDSGTWSALGWTDVATRTGITMKSREQKVGTLSEEEIVWVDTPEGTFFKRIPKLYPVSAQGSWLLNIAKFKAHGMGITLCMKNIQGTLVQDYQNFCYRYGTVYPANASDLNPDANALIMAKYNSHVADKVPRWNKPGESNGGIWMETWATRTIDNNLNTEIGLNVIEGVYGRDGNGFLDGPNTGQYGTNQCNDYMTNIIIFGMNQVYVDIIGHWLAGHEPGNFGLFHIAKEVGLSKVLNPARIPVYEWKSDGTATLTPLTDFTRTPLKTYYLQQNYNGGEEAYYHMCDEPFEYPYETAVATSKDIIPQAFVLNQNKPNPFNPYTSIGYSIPSGGFTRLEIYNASGQLVDVLVDGYKPAGNHMAVWNISRKASGIYFYRFRFGGASETKKMTLLK